MKFQKGMTYEEILEIVEANGLEILTEEDCELWGVEWIEMVILQNDHKVFVQVDEEGIYGIQFAPIHVAF